MKSLSKVVAAMPRSGIREFMEIASKLEDVIHLEAGEPDFVTPGSIIDAGFEAARSGFTKYTSNAGFLSLREALARKVREQNGLAGVTAANIVLTPGSVGALATGVLAVTNPGDEVLVPDPGWPNYINMVLLASATPVLYPLRREHGYLPDLDELDGLVTPRTKLIMLNNPCNPTGRVFPREVVARLAAFAARHDLYVLSDEIYEAMVFEGVHEPIAQFDADGRAITVFGFSKTFAMTGWRLGYAVAAKPVAELIMRLQEPLVSCASAISQKAAESALALPADVSGAMRDAYRERRDAVVRVLGGGDGGVNRLACVPEGAFYALVDLSDVGRDTYAIAHELLRVERVATAPGETFGPSCAGLLRIAFTTGLAEVEEGCLRIQRFAGRRGPDGKSGGGSGS